MSSRVAALAVFFAACLYPVNYAVSESVGLSVNYLFVLLPLTVVFVRGAVLRPPTRYLVLIAMYIGIVIFASVYQFDYLRFTPRRLLSFCLFLTMFVFMFAPIDRTMVKAFKLGVVGFSCVLALTSLVTYLERGGGALGASAKDIVGSSRIGFVYVLAFWIVALERPASRFLVKWKYPVLLTLVIGLFLTFSRASVFALLVSIALYAFSRLVAWARRPRLVFSKRVLASLVIAPLLVFGLLRSVPATVAFFNETFLQLVSDREKLTQHLTDPYYSEGFRMFLALDVLSFATRNPVTGSGFLGVWVISDTLTGSTHNQLIDVLFRTGWLGFAGYVYLLWQLLKYLHRHERPLFWGVVGILVYGNFHETFKESQGAFVLAFLLGLMSQRRTEELRAAPSVQPPVQIGTPRLMQQFQNFGALVH